MLTFNLCCMPKIPHINHEFLHTTSRAAILHAQAAESLEYNLRLLIETSDIEVFKKDVSKLDNIIALLRDSFLNTYKRDSESIIHEFIRRIYCGERGLDLMDAVRFVKFLKEFKKIAYKNLYFVKRRKKK